MIVELPPVCHNPCTSFPVALKSYTHPDLETVSLAGVLQALSDPCRLAIVRELLRAGELACTDVPLRISRATRSHHFSVLRDAGIIRTRTDGTRCMSSVREAEMEARFPGLLRLVLESRPEPPGRSAGEGAGRSPAGPSRRPVRKAARKPAGARAGQD